MTSIASWTLIEEVGHEGADCGRFRLLHVACRGRRLRPEMKKDEMMKDEMMKGKKKTRRRT